MARDRYSIWDIDNCLADDRHRLHLIDWSKEGDERYYVYNHNMDNDKPVHLAEFNVITAISRPVFFTGRPQAFQAMTEAWLAKHLGVTRPMMLMRPNGTVGMSPAVLKSKMLRALLELDGVDVQKIIGAFDDIPAVIAMYARAGIPGKVLQAHRDLEKVYAPSDLR